MTTKIKYVQLEPVQVLFDFYNSRMTAEQFGCYWLLILHLYCNNGRLAVSPLISSIICSARRESSKW